MILTQVAWSTTVLNWLLILVGGLPLQQALAIAAEQFYSAGNRKTNFSLVVNGFYGFY